MSRLAVFFSVVLASSAYVDARRHRHYHRPQSSTYSNFAQQLQQLQQLQQQLYNQLQGQQGPSQFPQLPPQFGPPPQLLQLLGKIPTKEELTPVFSFLEKQVPGFLDAVQKITSRAPSFLQKIPAFQAISGAIAQAQTPAQNLTIEV